MFDDFGLKKLEKDLNDAFKVKTDEKKPKRKFPVPKPKYTNQNINDAKKIYKESKSFVNNTIDIIKNRKIRKLEKQALKAKDKADKLRHEVKTLQALEDSETDIKRLEDELKKLKESKDE